jgi:transcriptional regulator with XRE-family HTH domain
MINREIFSYRLKQLRKEKNLSMQSLAQIVGLKSKGSIGQFETGINIPSAEILVAFAEFFNVSIDYLVGRTDKPEINK